MQGSPNLQSLKQNTRELKINAVSIWNRKDDFRYKMHNAKIATIL